MADPVLLQTAQSEVAMGHLGRITCLKDLPPDKKITGWIKEAMLLNDQGIKLPAKPKKAAAPIKIPANFLKALACNKTAKLVFEKFTNAQKKEYVQWITDAKTEATAQKRMAQALEWIALGKTRNWKYQTK
jgi:uncharacterized protein YdeI (YjbR/CyaY-like superfamily)